MTSEVKPRRLSIFGGLLWILIGTLLLVNNLVANFHVWQLFRQFWPVLLIVLGLTKLYDHFVTQRTGQAPARLLTGGEVFLLIMLFLVGGGIAALDEAGIRGHLRPEWGQIWGNSYSFNEETQHAIKAGLPIYIATPRGTITVYPQDITEVRVVARKTAWAMTEERGKEVADKAKVVVRETPTQLEISVERDVDRWGEVAIDLDVFVPRKSNVIARTERGGFSTAGLDGTVRATTRGGLLEVRDVTGNVEAEVRGSDLRLTGVKGDATVDGSCDEIEVGDIQGRATLRCSFTGAARLRNIGKQVYFKSVRTEFNAEKLPGRMEIGSGNLEVIDVPGNVELTTSRYDVLMENISGRIQVRNREGGVELRLSKPPLNPIDVENERGEVELVLPPGSAFEVTANSRRGEVESEFSGPELKIDNETDNGQMQGKIGARGPQLRLRTTYGTLRLRKTV